MGVIVAKQPNGLLCRLDTIMGNITAYDMTENEYIEHVAYLYAEMGRYEARKTIKNRLQSFQKVLNNLVYSNKEKGQVKEMLKNMGCEDEILK